jgi:hypothetical protein
VIPKATGSLLKPAGTHVVELIVADNEMVGRAPVPRPKSEGEAQGEPSYADLFRWVVVQTDGSGECP